MGIIMYGLTTCPHCKKALAVLENCGIDFETIWIDELEGDERKEVIEKVVKIIGEFSVPLVLKGDESVVGFNEDKLKRLVK